MADFHNDFSGTANEEQDHSLLTWMLQTYPVVPPQPSTSTIPPLNYVPAHLTRALNRSPLQDRPSPSPAHPGAPGHPRGPPLPIVTTRDPMEKTFEETQKQMEAANILESPERLIWYANAWNQTLPATRLHFMKQLALVDTSKPPPYYKDVYANEKWFTPEELEQRNAAEAAKRRPEPEQSALKKREDWSSGSPLGGNSSRRSAGGAGPRIKVEEDDDEEGVDPMDVEDSLSPQSGRQRGVARSSSGPSSSERLSGMGSGGKGKKRKSGGG